MPQAELVTPRVRSRVAAVNPVAPTVMTDTTPPAPPTPPTSVGSNSEPAQNSMRALAETYFRLNAAKNEADRESKKVLAELNKLMIANDQTSFDLTVDGVPVEAVISEDTVNEVDIFALRKRVDESTFMSVVSATQQNVKDVLGTNVLAAVLRDRVKPASLKVRKKK